MASLNLRGLAASKRRKTLSKQRHEGDDQSAPARMLRFWMLLGPWQTASEVFACLALRWRRSKPRTIPLVAPWTPRGSASAGPWPGPEIRIFGRAGNRKTGRSYLDVSVIPFISWHPVFCWTLLLLNRFLPFQGTRANGCQPSLFIQPPSGSP